MLSQIISLIQLKTIAYMAYLEFYIFNLFCSHKAIIPTIINILNLVKITSIKMHLSNETNKSMIKINKRHNLKANKLSFFKYLFFSKIG